jgi:endo-1,4-beta-xylanase
MRALFCTTEVAPASARRFMLSPRAPRWYDRVVPRRQRSVFAASALLVLATSVGRAQEADSTRPLRTLAPTHGIRIGAAVAYDALRTDAVYADVLRREFDVVTPENAMKWDTLHPHRHAYDFRDADRIVDTARRAGMEVRGHALVWHVQNPAWLARALTSRRRAIAILRAHIRRVARHFGRDVAQWDVVNEPLDPIDGRLRDTLWRRAIGDDYVAIALRFARRYAPHARLYLNEFGLETPGPKLDGMLALVADLRAQGAPLDAIGFQSHVLCLFGCRDTFATLGASLQRVSDLGVDVAITELDVGLIEPVTAASLAEQADTYGAAVDACLAVARCRTVVLWGFTDRYSWIPAFWAGLGAALPFDADYRPKPAYWALHDRLR